MKDPALNPVHPGEILLEDFLKPLQLTQYRLAHAIGVPPRRINEIMLGKRVNADGLHRATRKTSSSWLLNTGEAGCNAGPVSARGIRIQAA